MDTQYRYCDEVSLRELFYYYLRKWKGIIAAVLIGMLLAGGYKTYAMLRADKSKAEAAVAEPVVSLETQTARRNWEAARDRVEAEYDYQQKSILYNLDIDSFCGYRFVYCLSSLEPHQEDAETQHTQIAALCNAYNTLLKSGSRVSEIAEEEGIPRRYLWELIVFTQSATDETDKTIITVSVYHNTAEDAKRIAQKLVEGISQITENVNATVGAHELTLIEECPVEEVTSYVVDNKTTHSNRITTLQTELEKREKVLQALDPEYMVSQETAPKAVKSVFSIKSLLIYLIIGAICGAAFMAVIALIALLRDKTLNQAAEPEKRYHISLLGKFDRDIKRSGMDALIDCWEGRRRNPSREEGLPFLAERIRSCTAEEKRILITGMAGNAELQEFTERLGELVPEKCFTCGADLLHAPETLRSLRDADGVILIEACAVSGKEEIGAEIGLVRETGKKLIGYIVLE